MNDVTVWILRECRGLGGKYPGHGIFVSITLPSFSGSLSA
ncbi:hypothetical protein CBFG_04333 [Clostridiales bacterium 1_7_47FAA]|nr:hypothetical protein CBFG_04333 [Clostridiales bacterium 1_7_47FAA]